MKLFDEISVTPQENDVTPPPQPATHTPFRKFRVTDQLWAAAITTAKVRGETVSDVLRAALENYVEQHRAEVARALRSTKNKEK